MNMALAFATKPGSPIQNPNLKIFQNELHLHFSIKNLFGDWMACRVPLHISELTLNANESVAVIERAGKIRVASESVWQLICFQFVQAYFNSAAGERKILSALSSSIEFVSYQPAFHLCGNAVRPAALAIDINKILAQRSVANFLIRFGIMNIFSVQGLREEKGLLVLSITMGTTSQNHRASRKNFDA
jgi:hypothetical protein